MSPRALGVLACALLLGPACSSDEPAGGGAQPVEGPRVLSGEPGALPGPVGAPLPEAESPGAEPFSAPPPDQEPPATETNFLVPPCQKTSPAGDAVPAAGDAGPATGAEDGDAGVGASDAADAAASSEPFDQSTCQG